MATPVKMFVEPVGVLDTTVKRIVIDQEPRIQWGDLMQKIFDKLKYDQQDMALWILVGDKWEEFTQEMWEKEKDPIKLSRLRAVKVSLLTLATSHTQKVEGTTLYQRGILITIVKGVACETC